MNYKQKEDQGFREINHLVNLQDIAAKAFKNRSIDLKDVTCSDYTINYVSGGEVTFTFILKGLDDVKV